MGEVSNAVNWGEPEETGTADFSDSQKGTPDASTAGTRALKINAGWASGPTLEQNRQLILSGQENALRSDMARDKEIKSQGQRLKMLQDFQEFQGSTNKPVSPEEEAYFMGLSQRELEHPETVMEKHYGNFYVNTRMLPSHPLWGRVEGNIPDEGSMTQDKTAHLITQREIALTYLQDLENEYKSQDNVSKVWQNVKQFTLGQVPGYDQWFSRAGYLASIGEQSWTERHAGYASALQRRIQDLYRMPQAEFYETIRKETSNMNPLEKLHFVQSVANFGGSYTGLQNFFPYLDLATLGAMFTPVRKEQALMPFGPKVYADPIGPVPSGGHPSFVGPEQASTVLGRATGRTEEAMAKAKLSGMTGPVTSRNSTGEEISRAQRSFGGAYTNHDGQVISPEEILFMQTRIGEQGNGRKIGPDIFFGMGPEERVRGLIEARNNLITLGRAERAAQDTAVAAAEPNPIRAEGIAGRTENQAEVIAKQGMDDVIKQKNRDDRLVPILDQTISMMDPTAVHSAPGSHLGSMAGIRLQDQMLARRDRFMESINTAGQALVSRLPEEVLNLAYQDAKRSAARQYGERLVDAVLDVVPMDRDEFNTYKLDIQVGKRPEKPSPYAEVLAKEENYQHGTNKKYKFKHKPFQRGNSENVLLGNPNATLFESEEQALQWAREYYQLPDGSYTIKPQGGKAYISIEKPVQEFNERTRGAIITSDNETPVTLANALFGNWRSAEDILPKFIAQQRHLATTAPGEFRRVLLDTFKQIAAIPKRQRRELQELLDHQGDMPSPYNPEQRGYYSQTQGDLERDFYGKHGRQITEEQSNAYWTYVQLSDLDYLLRNMDAVRIKQLQGAQRFNIRFKDTEGAQTKQEFEGVDSRDLFESHSDHNFHYARIDNQGNVQVIYAKNLSSANKAALTTEIRQQGHKVLQVYEATNREFQKSFGTDMPVQFVITPSMEVREINPVQIKYNPGPHQIYPQPFFVKQPRIVRGGDGLAHYLGDATLHAFATERQAIKHAESYDQAARLYNAGRFDDLRTFLPNHLPYTFEEFNALVKKGALDVQSPVVYTKNQGRSLDSIYNGRTIESHYGENLRNHVQSEYNLALALDRTFTADRDAILPSIKEQYGTDGRPVFSLGATKRLDSFTALERALGQSTRNLFMGDLKTAAMEQWVSEWGQRGVLDLSKEALMRNPAYFFHHPQFNSKVVDARMERVAKASRQSTLNFIGHRTDADKITDWIENKVANLVYDAFGEGKALDISQKYLLPAIRDPWVYARSLAFHTKLGLFNPVQMAVQAQNLVHVMAIAGPTNGARAMSAAVTIRRLLAGGWPEGEIGAARIAHFADKVPGWGRNEFIDMVNNLRSSGYANVMGETAWKDDMSSPPLVRTSVGKFLDAGSFFFQEGERLTRLAAYAAAYKEWKVANPLKTFTNRDQAMVLTRADLMNVNMTRASMSNIQTGIFSVPSQFLTFNARLSEQLLPGLLKPIIEGGARLAGKEVTVRSRLSPKEAYTAMAAYSMMYGIPVAIGGASFVFPAYDTFKSAMIDRGIDTSNNPFLESLAEGIPAAMIHAATGKDYAIGSRLGIDANQLFWDAMTGNKSILDIALGASGGVVKDFAKALGPSLQGFVSFVKDQGESFPLMSDDFMDFSKTVASVSNGMKMYYAMSLNKYFTKNGQYVAPVSSIDGLMMGLLGVQPMELKNAQIMRDIMHSQKEAQKYAGDQYVTEMRKAIQSGSSGDKDNMQYHLTRAQRWKIVGDFNPIQINELAKQLTGTAEIFGQLEKTKSDFWNWHHVPASKTNDHMDYIYPDRRTP